MSTVHSQTTVSDSGREAELIAAAQAGDHAAFLDLAAQYQEPLYRLIYALALDEEQAETLAQEALVRAWRTIGSYPTGRRFYPWLFRIARNLPYESSPPSSLRGHGDGIAKALHGLRRDDRMALALRVVEKLPYPEIAALLDAPTGIVILRIAQARGIILGSADGHAEGGA
jgi:DNA-directed RNA polymerase specialized sigma24 family protein